MSLFGAGGAQQQAAEQNWVLAELAQDAGPGLSLVERHSETLVSEQGARVG